MRVMYDRACSVGTIHRTHVTRSLTVRCGFGCRIFELWWIGELSPFAIVTWLGREVGFVTPRRRYPPHLTNARLDPPRVQRIGQDIFDLAFIMDADGVLLELVHKKDTLAVDMPQAW